MAFLLNQTQTSVFDFVEQTTLELKTRFHNGEDITSELAVVAGYAFALHRDLTAAGWPLQFTDNMLSNRKVPVTDPEFFRLLAPLEDFLALVTQLTLDQ